ncbi:MAG: hypothetical protein HYY01_00825 [Chloroflexi bacterium]|nr:hypothetical protein [Chloroflexota bacterium]
MASRHRRPRSLSLLTAPAAMARPAAAPSVVGSVFLDNNAGEIAANPTADRVYVARIRVTIGATGEVAPGFYDARLTIQQTP